jgi:ankyrin repeat protein
MQIFRKILLTVFILGSLPLWSQTGISIDKTRLVTESVFEVIIEKPAEGNLKYEEELPFDLLPFHIRNDKYISIGTAFAVGNNLFLSAAHVFSLDDRTTRKNLSLRNSTGEVYPVLKVLKYDNNRDFILFTIGKLNNSRWLELSKEVNINEYVNAVGNAYGEGIIFRNGLLTSRTPERENGEWHWLRFSAAASPGNSGGPLLNENGDVIGIVTAKSDNENLNYALPVSEVGELVEEDGVLHLNITYRIPNINYKHRNVYDYSFSLPQDNIELKKQLSELQEKAINESINNLLRERKEEIFPNDTGSDELLTTTYATTFPNIINEKDDSTWQLSQPDDLYTSELGDGGYLRTGKIWGDTFWQLELPEDEIVKDYFTSPEKLMDIILAGNKTTRTIGSADIRIISYGQPKTVQWHKDRWGRQWLKAVWDLPFADRETLLFALPTPSGAVGIMSIARTSNVYAYNLDFLEMINYIYVSFSADFKQWKQYIENWDMAADLFRDFQFTYSVGKSVHIETSSFDLVYDGSLIGISNQSRIYMVPSFLKSMGSAIWDISRLFIYEKERSKNYIALEKNFRPVDSYDTEGLESWHEVVERKYPYNRDPIISKGNTYIYETRNIQNDMEIDPSLNSLWTYYLAREGEIDDRDMISLFMKLSSGFSLSEKEKEASVYGTGLEISQAPLPMIGGINIFQAISTDNNELLDQFIKTETDLEVRNKEGKTPLMVALRMEKQEISEKLLEAGSEINVSDYTGHTPLLISLRNLPEGMAKKLLEKGADPGKSDNLGYSPLMVANQHKFDDVALMIAGMGVPLDPVNTLGRSALYYALYNGMNDIAKELIRRDAPVSLDKDVSYSMFLAALDEASPEVARLLMDKGTRQEGETSKGWTILMSALRYGKPDIASDLIRSGTSFNYTNHDGWTPLHIAVRYSTLENVKLLIVGGADANAKKNDNTDVLMLSFYNEDNRQISDYLLEKGLSTNTIDDSGWSTFMTALRYGTNDQAWNVLNSTSIHEGATINGWTPLMFSLRYGNSDIAQYLVENGSPLNNTSSDGLTALHLAAGYSDIETVQFLIEHGARTGILDVDNYSAMMNAIKKGKADIAAYLMDIGSPMNISSNSGWTPLMLAIRYCPPVLAKVFILRESPINISKTDNGWTDLHLAARYSTAEICRMILDHGADIHKKTNDDYTILHLAAGYNEEFVSDLIERGVNLNVQNSSGDTPLHKAVEKNKVKSVKLLLQAGALTNIRNNDEKTASEMLDDNDPLLLLFY